MAKVWIWIWCDFVTNSEVLKEAEVHSTEAMLLKTVLCWAEHVSRKGDHHLPEVALCGELSSGYRDIGAPKKRHKTA